MSPVLRRSRPSRVRSPRRRRVTSLGALVLLLVLVPTSVSYGQALTYPGSASFSVRSVEWVRDHGGAPVVDAVENWYYSRHAPAATGAPQETLSAGARTSAVRTSRARAGRRTAPAAQPGDPGQPGQPGRPADPLPPVRLLRGVSPLSGEGTWRPVGVDGVLQATWLRADRRHLPVVATAVLVPAGRFALHLAPGTREPVVGAAPRSATRVPTSALAKLAATFNAGFKMQDSHGGFQLGGRTYVPLRRGRASVVVTTAGGWRIGAWGSGAGSGVGPAGDVAAVRQNLDLVVSGGHPAPGIDSNAGGHWGTAHTQFQYTTRSGLGVTATGDLVYVSGQGMTLAVLADAMSRLGVVTGMQLDIHPQMVTFNLVSARTHRLAMSALATSMRSSSRRYLTVDQRDFFYLTVR